jgi:hypothetical protein
MPNNWFKVKEVRQNKIPRARSLKRLSLENHVESTAFQEIVLLDFQHDHVHSLTSKASHVRIMTILSCGINT